MRAIEASEFAKYEHFNPVALRYLLECAPNPAQVLDVGCWTGSLGEQIVRNSHCEVDGIDTDESAARVAKSRGYRDIYILQLDDLQFRSIHRRYDIIVLGDVLEHTREPQRVLEALMDKLKPGGHLIIALPNVGFALYRLLHLFGQWNYRQAGIMDKTHLRFFTVRSMKRLFADAQLDVVRYQGMALTRRSLMFINRLAKIRPSLFAIQVTFLLRRGADDHRRSSSAPALRAAPANSTHQSDLTHLANGHASGRPVTLPTA